MAADALSAVVADFVRVEVAHLAFHAAYAFPVVKDAFLPVFLFFSHTYLRYYILYYIFFKIQAKK